MGRSPCCDKVGLKKGPWTPEEDHKLLAYIEEHGHGSWRALPSKAGLQRCGKSCRLRWTNYLRPDIKRGKFSLQEEQTIIQLHALLGNRWSAIATHLPKRTDNEIKNYWNTHLKKRLAKLGIDPVTHKPKTDALLSTSSSSDGHQSNKNAANLSHMAQWESARLEAEARLVRQSKLRSSINKQASEYATSPSPSTSAVALPHITKPIAPPCAPPRCLDVLKNLNGPWIKPTDMNFELESSPTSTVSYSENAATQISNTAAGASCEAAGILKEEGEEVWRKFGNSSSTHLPESYRDNDGIDNNSISFTTSLTLHDMNMAHPFESAWEQETLFRADTDEQHEPTGGNFVEKFTDLLLSGSADRSFSHGGGGDGETTDNGGSSSGNGADSDFYGDNKIYWNNILDLVNASPSDSSVFLTH